MNTATAEAKSFEKGIVTEKDYYALSVGATFGLIARELSKLKPHILQKSTIKEILNWPLVPKDENINNSDGRNKFVELELAANLSSILSDPIEKRGWRKLPCDLAQEKMRLFAR